MRFEACSMKIYEEGLRYYKPSNNLALLEAFIESDHECVRIIDHTWKTPAIGATSLRKSIDRYRFGGIKVFMRKGEIYLVKTHTK